MPHTSVYDAVMHRWAEVKRDGQLSSVRELCAAAGISRTTWYALQDADSRPARATVSALAGVLGLATEELLRLAGYRGAPLPAPVAHTPDPAGATGR